MDAEVRRLERALAAAPSDERLRRAVLRLRVRCGLEAPLSFGAIVKGEGNRVALLVLQALARRPRIAARTLVLLEGPSGSGKTLLLRTLAAERRNVVDDVLLATADDLHHEIARALARDGRFELPRGIVIVDDYARCDLALAQVLVRAALAARAALVVAGPGVAALRPIARHCGVRARLVALGPLPPRARLEIVSRALARIERGEHREPGSFRRPPRAGLPPSGFELEGIARRMALEMSIELGPRV